MQSLHCRLCAVESGEYANLPDLRSRSPPYSAKALNEGSSSGSLLGRINLIVKYSNPGEADFHGMKSLPRAVCPSRFSELKEKEN